MEQKRLAGEKSTEYIKDGMIIGLGTGSTVYYMIEKLGDMVSKGMKIKAVATSHSTERLAKTFDIQVVSIDEVDHIDLAIDGVDEIDSSFNAIKGGGGALFREKIVASLSKQVIWILDESKYVDAVGEFPLPVEILPFGYTHTLKRLNDHSLNPELRVVDGNTFITDNGNYIVDLHLGKHLNIREVIQKLNSVTGVLENGFFINMCDRIIVGSEDHVKVIDNPCKYGDNGAIGKYK
ncbi:MAG: ribose-5-phosphate isomerase RpiA [Bacillota bacterium]|nr:ribose-5-phosphate isomerase RpiA [Bacillota bacterium]